MDGEETLPKPSGRATLPKKEVFKLHGIELNGLFGVHFAGDKWKLEKFSFQETKISGNDVQKLAEASKAKIAVPIEYGNGKGTAKIGYLHYDPKKEMLTSISIELLEWSFK